MCKTMIQLESAVADYRSLKALKEDLEKQIHALEQDIIEYLDFNRKLSETGTNFTVKISQCARTTVDTHRLELDLGSLAEYYRTTNYRRLYVK